MWAWHHLFVLFQYINTQFGCFILLMYLEHFAIKMMTLGFNSLSSFPAKFERTISTQKHWNTPVRIRCKYTDLCSYLWRTENTIWRVDICLLEAGVYQGFYTNLIKRWKCHICITAKPTGRLCVFLKGAVMSALWATQSGCCPRRTENKKSIDHSAGS